MSFPPGMVGILSFMYRPDGLDWLSPGSRLIFQIIGIVRCFPHRELRCFFDPGIDAHRLIQGKHCFTGKRIRVERESILDEVCRRIEFLLIIRQGDLQPYFFSGSQFAVDQQLTGLADIHR